MEYIPVPNNNIITEEFQHITPSNVVRTVAKLLLEVTCTGANIKPILTLSKMASSIDTTPDIVNRSLISMQEKGMITMANRRIVIIDKELLQQMVDDPEYQIVHCSG
ncbi:MAG: winged helix-turn-helix domain-containing protein [Dehalococcoidales bacterium]|nr:MAG: winged helix-turn-helix domain-containing protein [Dehalococcoidales bacterium]